MKQLRRLIPALAALALIAAGTSALAVKVGEPLYVKAKNTALKKSPSPTADNLAVLQPGEKVTWKGAHKSDKQWHQVETGGKSGVVFVSNLSPKPPATEVVAGKGKPMDAQAFASSGAAVKALGPGAESYGKANNSTKTVAQITALEGLAKSVTDAEVAEHAKSAGIFQVVGANGEAKVARGGEQ